MVKGRAQSSPVKLVPLRDAPEKFAPPRFWREQDEARARPPLPPQPTFNVENREEGLRIALMQMARGLDDLRIGMDLSVARHEDILRQLRESKLEAFGVQSAPIQKRNFERIRSHFFMDAEVNWNRNSISNFGVTYTAVGVCRSVSAPKIKSIASPTSLSRGRPSKASEIERAIDLLTAEGEELATMPRPDAYEAVRQCAKRSLRADVAIGFTDPVIQRVLFRRFGPRR
jgi:hypothetical protein